MNTYRRHNSKQVHTSNIRRSLLSTMLNVNSYHYQRDMGGLAIPIIKDIATKEYANWRHITEELALSINN